MASGPEIYVGNKGTQRHRDSQAYYGHCYSEAILKLRTKNFAARDRGVPLEYFTWERIVIDECHETLVTGKKDETTIDGAFKEKARRGARKYCAMNLFSGLSFLLSESHYFSLSSTCTPSMIQESFWE